MSRASRPSFFTLVILATVMAAPLGTDAAGPMKYDLEVEKIRSVLPEKWSIVEARADALPEGHYWGMQYDGPKGFEVVIQGPRDVAFDWKDQQGAWHQEPVAKEALRLWLMPAEYRESWRRFFVMKRPKSVKLLRNAQNVRVYAEPSSRTVDTARVEQIVREAVSTAWRDRPDSADDLTWKSWSTDLDRALRDR